jgi:hypothetical protein
MAQALDYSAGFPGAQAIAGAGYSGAIRYIGFPEKRKCATAGELADFSVHGIGMALVFESTLTDWRGGFGAGQVSAARARDHANDIGFSPSRPIYMAIDQDVVTSGEFNVMLDYLRGAGASLGGPELTGVYGEADVIDRARDAGVAHWFWQTAAWSRGRRTAAHIYQHVGTVFVGGIACDTNDIQADDWGQHNAQEDDMRADEPVISPQTGDSIGPFTDVIFYTNYFVNMIPSLHAKLDALSDALSDTEANIIAAIRGDNPDVSRLSSQLTQVLGPQRAADLARELSAGNGGNGGNGAA